MEESDVILAVSSAGGITGVFVLAQVLLKKIMVTATDITGESARRDIILELREEIARLQVVIDGMRTRIETLESKTALMQGNLQLVRSHALVAYRTVTSRCKDCPQATELEYVLRQIISDD